MITKYTVLFAAGALAVLGSAVLVNAHGGSTASIHACVKSDGRLFVVDADENYRNNETALDWNIAGPQGAPGATGPAGPSNAYTDQVALVDAPASGAEFSLASVDVPSGDYLLTATVQVRFTTSGDFPRGLNCAMRLGATGVSAFHQTTIPSGVDGYQDYKTFSFQGRANDAAAGTVTLHCAANFGGEAVVTSPTQVITASVAALKVGDLDLQ